jgi:hypothetical protein
MSRTQMGQSHGALRQELDSLCQEAQQAILKVRRRRALHSAMQLALPSMLLVPFLWLVLRIAMGVSGEQANISGWWVIPASLLIPACVLGSAALSASFAKVSRRDALATLDQELELEDRLVTAEEFLQQENTTPFIEAAIEDAARVAPEARSALLSLGKESYHPGPWDKHMAAASLVMILLGAMIGPRSTGFAAPDVITDSLASQLAQIDLQEQTPTPKPDPQGKEPNRQAPVIAASSAKSKTAESQRDQASELSDETKQSEGKTGEGRSSDAESTSGASESKGTPSNQAQKSDAGAPSKKKEKKKKAKPQANPESTKKEDAEENSGSTAGKGSSKGSSKNPAASKWSSKDQVTTEDDQEIEDDEDTEDEEEDQESRGGMQPSLRNRKPPASRDLRIGFGNQKSPDANGRGGPSEAKKSRGTASLVLGVPIPDRVKGQPNPGKTKITQERIEPKAEEGSAIQARSQTPRSAPAGNVHERELTPWMRTLVREYFLTLRQQKRQS